MLNTQVYFITIVKVVQIEHIQLFFYSTILSSLNPPGIPRGDDLVPAILLTLDWNLKLKSFSVWIVRIRLSSGEDVQRWRCPQTSCIERFGTCVAP